jgi:hypothetical protein
VSGGGGLLVCVVEEDTCARVKSRYDAWHTFSKVLCVCVCGGGYLCVCVCVCVSRLIMLPLGR